MDNEMVDILDGKGNPTGEVKLKREAHAKGLWHRASHTWIYNSKGEVLLQLRLKNKILYPNLWDVSAAGHVSAGQSYDEAAVRELFEELGVKAAISELKNIENRKLDIKLGATHNREFIQVYLLKFNKDINDLKVQKEEIDQVKFMPLEKFESEINDSAKAKKYVPHRKYYSDVIQCIREELRKTS